MKAYKSGALVRVLAAFTDVNGDAANPTLVTLKWQPGTGAVVQTTTAATQGPLTGDYYFDLDTTGWAGPGNQLWIYEYIGTGAVQAINDDKFEVEPPAL